MEAILIFPASGATTHWPNPTLPKKAREGLRFWLHSRLTELPKSTSTSFRPHFPATENFWVFSHGAASLQPEKSDPGSDNANGLPRNRLL